MQHCQGARAPKGWGVMADRKRCGTCRWWSRTRGPFGDCLCWATLDRKVVPEAARIIKEPIHERAGKKCPCHQPKDAEK